MNENHTVKPADVLVIVPHPDDAEYGVAGTVARWTAEGKAVVYLLCTSGEKGTSDPNVKPAVLAKTREREQREAVALLGVREVVFLRLPDQGLEDNYSFRRELVRAIRLYKPRTVVAPDPYRRYIWHRDHRITGQVALDAVFPYARDHLSFPELLDKGLQPHKVRELLLYGAEDINYRSDITATFELKFAALCCHRSQVDGRNKPNLKQWLKERARSAAKGTDYELAEAFHREEIPW